MMAASNDSAALRGLPAPLPEGEEVLWQGAPQRAALAREALHVRKLVLYFGGAALFVAGLSWNEGRSLGVTAVSIAVIAAACLLVLGFVRVLSWLIVRSTVYTITNRRIVMRIGIALPITLNIPFAEIAGAGLRLQPGGTGDLPLALGGTGRIGYIHLWPHARPWRVSKPEPMLRCVPEAGQVAAILARAIGSSAPSRREAVRPSTTDAVNAAAAA
jgi:hypothetical protein